MEKACDVLKTVTLLLEKTDLIYKSRREQLEEDESTLKEIINMLALECREGRSDEEKVMKDFQKAREDRDEYRFKLHMYENKIIALEEELAELKMAQAQQNISVSNIDKLKLNAEITQTPSKDESSTSSRSSPELLKRELQYLHKKNEEFLEEIRKLKISLKSQTELNDKLANYEEEISNLKSVIDTKNTKIMDLQIESEEKLKKAKLEFNFMLSSKIDAIEEMHKVKNNLQISLQEAHEEIKLLKQKQLKQIKEDSENRSIVLCPEKDTISQRQTTVSDHSTPKVDTRHKSKSINIQNKDEGNLKSIENMITEDISLIEKVPEKMDDVSAAENGKTRGRTVRQASKNATAEIKKQAEISLEKADKFTKPRQRKRAKGNLKGDNTERNPVAAIPEADENADPCCPSSSRSLVPITSGKEKQTKSKLPVNKNSFIKEMDDSSRQTQRRRNK